MDTPTLDRDLPRVRVTGRMDEAIREAARREGINVTAWRKRAYALRLTEQLGPQWSDEATAQ